MKNNLITFPQIRIEIGLEPYSRKTLNYFKKVLKEFLDTKFSNQNLVYKSCKPYWKKPEMTLCYFLLYSSDLIRVKNIINLFDTPMSYSMGRYKTTYKGIDCIFDSEDAVWSKFGSGGVFLHENIKWVEISTNPISEDLFGKTT